MADKKSTNDATWKNLYGLGNQRPPSSAHLGAGLGSYGSRVYDSAAGSRPASRLASSQGDDDLLLINIKWHLT
jgi:hypothetical protein